MKDVNYGLGKIPFSSTFFYHPLSLSIMNINNLSRRTSVDYQQFQTALGVIMSKHWIVLFFLLSLIIQDKSVSAGSGEHSKVMRWNQLFISIKQIYSQHSHFNWLPGAGRSTASPSCSRECWRSPSCWRSSFTTCPPCQGFYPSPASSSWSVSTLEYSSDI